MHFRSKHMGDFKNLLRINKIFDLSDSYFPNPSRHFILILTLNFNIDVGTIKQNCAMNILIGCSRMLPQKRFPRGSWGHFSASATHKCVAASTRRGCVAKDSQADEPKATKRHIWRSTLGFGAMFEKAIKNREGSYLAQSGHGPLPLSGSKRVCRDAPRGPWPPLWGCSLLLNGSAHGRAWEHRRPADTCLRRGPVPPSQCHPVPTHQLRKPQEEMILPKARWMPA